MTDPRAVMAARNNGDLYRAIFAAQGKGFDARRYAFVAVDPPPPYYAALTVLSPGHAPEIDAELARLARQFGGEVGFKDSFCEFPPGRPDLQLLFEASWIHHPPMTADAEGWTRLRRAEELQAWESAWKGGGSPTETVMFDPVLLERADFAFFAKWQGGVIVAGCIGNLSEDCVGLSNLFSTGVGEMVFAEAARAVGSLNPGLPIVGYSHGPELAEAVAAGFAPVAPLRVFLKRP
jgi:hypothetical protein